ncbi:MAG TPA: hypothetical protein VF695_16605 [Sphingomonas sp.]
MFEAFIMTLLAPSAMVQKQDSPSSPPARSATVLPDDSQPDDIVVTGYRRGKARDRRVQVPAAASAIRNRVTYDYSERLAKCAARSHLTKLSRLRDVVDGEFNSARQITAQDRLVRSYITCGESPTLLSFTSRPREAASVDLASAVAGDYSGSPGIPEAAPLGYSIYDRGAFTIQAMKMFAPDLTLTRKDTNDPEVQVRFNAREVARNRFRLPTDYRYFEVAVCMVRLEPRLSVRLAMSTGSARLGDVQEALIDRARVCVGGARNVQVDPTQFRLYIADAVYRWAIAARGVDTLIPEVARS